MRFCQPKSYRFSASPLLCTKLPPLAFLAAGFRKFCPYNPGSWSVNLSVLAVDSYTMIEKMGLVLFRSVSSLIMMLATFSVGWVRFFPPQCCTAPPRSWTCFVTGHLG
ncbi:transmembrane protein, putative [Medicago truncatula]|uniref:Transmembrane protein, putative n=1 Tax=Medicago truncatula TaxID=3880 RepID=G7IXI5_MEDTR|nr:transmembrane protein, putative [Medicago truncatula]